MCGLSKQPVAGASGANVCALSEVDANGGGGHCSVGARKDVLEPRLIDGVHDDSPGGVASGKVTRQHVIGITRCDVQLGVAALWA
jgi:hypothetical protein